MGLTPIYLALVWSIFTSLSSEERRLVQSFLEQGAGQSQALMPKYGGERHLLAQECLGLIVKLQPIQEIVIPVRPLSEDLGSILQDSTSSDDAPRSSRINHAPYTCKECSWTFVLTRRRSMLIFKAFARLAGSTDAGLTSGLA